MTFRFRANDMPDRDIWCAGAEAAHAFVGTAEVLSGVLRVRSGIADPVDGVCAIDFQEFGLLSAAAVHRFSTSDQGILRSLSLGFIATSLVLIDRAGHPAPPMPGPAQERAWAALRDQHARAMPV
ncbi:DUF6086 family protein [Streptomyces sp. NPDC020490]|uniref:DUF6086 family protein n=1 Tax=Streptomyces sp. NPDC020490 TaxID=3365078 RepID=UPI0037BD7163